MESPTHTARLLPSVASCTDAHATPSFECAVPLRASHQASQQQRLQSRASTWKRDEDTREKSAVRQQIDDARAVNRAAHRRYLENYQYGYNIVDHRDYRCRPPPLQLMVTR